METTRNGGGRIRSPLLGLSDLLNRVSELALFVMMMAMIVITTLQIVCRFFFDALIWSEEIVCFLLVAASLLGAAVAFKRGTHIAVTSLVEKLPVGLQKVVSVCVQLVGIGFFVVVAWYGGVLTKSESFQTTPALGISMSWIYLMYPVIGTITLVHLAAHLHETFRR
jgi:TRAP-type C4-dicarboxylate transport system permease small subunit